MYKKIQRLLGFVTYDTMEEAVALMAAEFEVKRNLIRKEGMESLEKLNLSKSGDEVQKVLASINNQLTSLYEKELAIKDFMSKIK